MDSSSTSVGGSSTASHSTSTPNEASKRTSKDIGWDYGSQYDKTKPDRVQCNFCDMRMGSGVHRLKHHVGSITGNVKPCLKATPEAREACRIALGIPPMKKKLKSDFNIDIRSEVSIPSSAGSGTRSPSVTQRSTIDLEDDIAQERQTNLGPMHRFVGINPEKSTDSRKFTKQANMVNLLDKKRVLETQQYIARWVLESGTPFNALQLDSFQLMIEAIGQFGPGLPAPSRHRLSNACLTTEVERIKTDLAKHEEEWSNSGCSIMTDAWSDRKRRSVMNLCVHCREGISFLSSREDSDSSHTGEYIFKYVDKCIDHVGAEKVVQVVTDNAANNMRAADLMALKRPNIFWTSCATHTINLMLEGIGRLPKFKSTIDKAKALTIFIYSHHSTLSLMRRHTKGEIVRPGVTRFASTFLTLKSLNDKQEKLKFMFASEEYQRCSHSKSPKGKSAYNTVFSLPFWKKVNWCLVVFTPLVRVLRIADGDRPSMPWLHGELEAAKEEIKNKACKGVERNYKSLLDIIELKSKGRVDGALHLSAYFLNPYYYAKNRDIIKDYRVMDAMQTCVDKFYASEPERGEAVMNDELIVYTNLDGSFGKKYAISGYKGKDASDFNPVGWWSIYGGSTPGLRTMAIRILSLTTSSSGCERNWSTFEGVHTKKRNRLDSQRLEKLVYVQFNSKLLAKKQRASMDKEILQADDYYRSQHFLVEGVVDNEQEDELQTNEVVMEDDNAVREPFEDEEFLSEPEPENQDDDNDFGSDEDEDATLVPLLEVDADVPSD